MSQKRQATQFPVQGQGRPGGLSKPGNHRSTVQPLRRPPNDDFCLEAAATGWGCSELFDKNQTSRKQIEGQVDELYRQIGQLQGRKRFFSTKARLLSQKERKPMIDPDLRKPSISRQCQLLALSRSSFYF